MNLMEEFQAEARFRLEALEKPELSGGFIRYWKLKELRALISEEMLRILMEGLKFDP